MKVYTSDGSIHEVIGNEIHFVYVGKAVVYLMFRVDGASLRININTVTCIANN